MEGENLTVKKSKRLTVKESKNLVWTTWFGIIIYGIVVYLFTNPIRVPVILAGLPLLFVLVNFWVNAKYIPCSLYSTVPAVFLPTAFLTGFGALVYALMSGEEMYNSVTLGLEAVCLTSIMMVYPESQHADYS